MRTIRDEDRQARSSDGTTVTIEGVRCTRVSTKAILVHIDGAEHWIPQSQIHDDSEVYQLGDDGKLVITQWIADHNGLV
jgi:hypothetical protein